MKKEHKNKHPSKEVFFYIWLLMLVIMHFLAAFWKFDFLSQITTFSISLFILTIVSLFIQRQILVIYGEEVEVSGQKYFKKWYTASLFSLFVNFVSVLIGIFLCIEVFQLDSFIQIGWLWAGILAFMWFTAPVWAIDMIAGIILLQSKNYETGNVIYIHGMDKAVWIKSISLTEVKCIDLKTSNPIIFRPSKFRDLTIKNLSQWIVWKTSKILREISLKVDYSIPKKSLESLLYEAFDTLQVDLLSPDTTNYFWDDPYRELIVQSFWDYGVEYTFFYTITSPFYVHKAQKILQEYFLKAQQEKGIYFSTPDLIRLEKKEEL